MVLFIVEKVLPSFYRSGTNHKYKSTEAAFKVGGRIQETFKWTAKMKNYDIEVPEATACGTSTLIWNQFFYVNPDLWGFLDLQDPDPFLFVQIRIWILP